MDIQSGINSQPVPAGSPTDLKVLTINYCGIMNNPFEFYSSALWEPLSRLSSIFDTLVREKVGAKEGFKWKMGKIEQKVRLGRYSPSFDLNVGIHQSGTRFVTADEFRERWNSAFAAMVDKTQGLKFEAAEAETTFTYDLIFFHALLAYVFNKSDFDQLILEDPEVYRQALRPFFDQSFLDEKRKLAKVCDTLFKLDFDILFLQEYSPMFEEFVASQSELYGYMIGGGNDTITVVKRSSFSAIQKAEQVLTAQEMEGMNWNGKTTFLIVDDIILINAHLSSAKEKNDEQMNSLRQTVWALKETRPQYHIILGGDLNAYLGPDGKFETHFHLFPYGENEITTVKMRTMAQGQYHKGNVSNVESKDKILTDLPITLSAITLVDGHTPADSKSYIPSDDHPFDHFLLACAISRH